MTLLFVEMIFLRKQRDSFDSDFDFDTVRNVRNINTIYTKANEHIEVDIIMDDSYT